MDKITERAYALLIYFAKLSLEQVKKDLSISLDDYILSVGRDLSDREEVRQELTEDLDILFNADYQERRKWYQKIYAILDNIVNFQKPNADFENADFANTRLCTNVGIIDDIIHYRFSDSVKLGVVKNGEIRFRTKWKDIE
jgi:hypothetical protein